VLAPVRAQDAPVVRAMTSRAAPETATQPPRGSDSGPSPTFAVPTTRLIEKTLPKIEVLRLLVGDAAQRHRSAGLPPPLAARR